MYTCTVVGGRRSLGYAVEAAPSGGLAEKPFRDTMYRVSGVCAVRERRHGRIGRIRRREPPRRRDRVEARVPLACELS
jgi:hypothetical protein